MGLGRPWMSLMPASGEDTEEDYKTFWEFTTKQFKTQLCTVKRAIGADDIGRFKLKENIDYKVQVGAKVFYSKTSSALQRAGDVAEPFLLNMDFDWPEVQMKEELEDGSLDLTVFGALFTSFMALATL